jgi:hypothetical protein
MPYAVGFEIILEPNRDTVKRCFWPSRHDLPLGHARGVERGLLRQRNKGVYLVIKPPNSVQAHFG